MKKFWIVCLTTSMLIGCSQKLGGSVFFNHIEQIDGSIQQGDWNSIIIQATELKEIYQHNKWKIQLLGDEGEYEGLYGGINKLIAASHEKDVINARLELAMIKSILEDIYSL